MRDVNFDTGGQLDAAPHGTLRQSRFERRTRTVGALQCDANLIERLPGRLQFFDLQQPIEMFLTVVMRSAPHAQRRRNQPFLHVVPDGTA